eukprot:scaffold2041_cov37-Cyclotella_meneghiniana.AAC.7
MSLKVPWFQVTPPWNDTHHGLRLPSKPEAPTEEEQMKLPPQPVGYGLGGNLPPPFPPPFYRHVGMPPTAPPNLQSKSSTGEITVSTLSGTIGKTELMLLMNSMADQIKPVIETSFGVIQPLT